VRFRILSEQQHLLAICLRPERSGPGELKMPGVEPL
jgi:hypothetical protein